MATVPTPPLEKGAARGRPKRVAPNIKTIYVPGPMLSVWDEFIAITSRDKTSVSEEVVAFIDKQVKMRRPGNPQRPLEPFLREIADQFENMNLEQLYAEFEKVYAAGEIEKTVAVKWWIQERVNRGESSRKLRRN